MRFSFGSLSHHSSIFPHNRKPWGLILAMKSRAMRVMTPVLFALTIRRLLTFEKVGETRNWYGVKPSPGVLQLSLSCHWIVTVKGVTDRANSRSFIRSVRAYLDTAPGAPDSSTAQFADDRHKCRAGGRRSACHATSLGAVSSCARSVPADLRLQPPFQVQVAKVNFLIAAAHARKP